MVMMLNINEWTIRIIISTVCTTMWLLKVMMQANARMRMIEDPDGDDVLNLSSLAG